MGLDFLLAYVYQAVKLPIGIFFSRPVFCMCMSAKYVSFSSLCLVRALPVLSLIAEP